MHWLWMVSIMDDIVDLIQDVFKDNSGVKIKRGEIRETVYCNVKSIGSQEFDKASARGLKPQYCFEIFRFDFHGQSKLEYNGVPLRVYRTYIKGDLIELYTESGVGL